MLFISAKGTHDEGESGADNGAKYKTRARLCDRIGESLQSHLLPSRQKKKTARSARLCVSVRLSSLGVYPVVNSAALIWVPGPGSGWKTPTWNHQGTGAHTETGIAGLNVQLHFSNSFFFTFVAYVAFVGMNSSVILKYVFIYTFVHLYISRMLRSPTQINRGRSSSSHARIALRTHVHDQYDTDSMEIMQ